MQRFFGQGYDETLLLIHKGTLQIISLAVLITVSYSLAQENGIVQSGELHPISAVITALASFVVISSESNEIIIGVESANATGMFSALLISVAATYLFFFFYSLRDRLNPANPLAYNAGLLIHSSFRVILPALLTISLFSLGKSILNATDFPGIRDFFIQELNKRWLASNSYFSALLIILGTQMLWFFGISGGNILMDSVSDIPAAAAAGINSGIFTKTFFDTFVYLGGAGATMGLLFATLFIAGKTNNKRLAKISFLPGIFNINEPIVYGLPIIFNPYCFIPFFLSPVVLCITSALAITWGWVPAVTRPIAWTTPIFLSGYLGTSSVAGVILQAFNLGLSILIYLPFILLQERNEQRAGTQVFENLESEINYIEQEQQKTLLNRHDENRLTCPDTRR